MSGFNIPLGADVEGLQKDMSKASQITQRSSDLMAQSVGVVNAKQMLLNQTLAAQLANVQKLSVKYGENSNEALKMAASAERTRMQLAQMVSPVNVVGGVAQKASGQFNALGNSVNQLTREMPAFANSAQTGFMAISNNLPIFFDAISGIKKANAELVAQGKPAASVMSQLGASVFSLGTALSLGVTALTLYGPQLFNLAKELFTTSEAYDKASDDSEMFTSILNSQNSDLQKNIRSIKERNKLLGIKLAAAQGGVTVEAETINYEKNRLANMQRILQQMQSQTQTFEINGVKALSGIYAAQIEPYTKKIERQKQVIAGLEEEYNTTQKIESIKQGPIIFEGLKTAWVPEKIDVRDPITKLRASISDEIAKNKVDMSNFIDTSSIGKGMGFVRTLFAEEFATMTETVRAMAGQVGLAATNAIGESLVTGELDFSGITNMIAQLANTIATSLLAIGVALASNPATAGLASGYFVTAAALGVTAGVIRGMGKSGSSNNNQMQNGSTSEGWSNEPSRKMAEGGLLYGKTAFIGGEYSGAASNPEVVAPLNKLKGMIGGGGAMVEGMITGRNLRLVTIKEDKFRQMNYGR